MKEFSRNTKVNFKKYYENNLKRWAAGSSDTQWVKLSHENFETDVQRLKILSGRTWCTKIEDSAQNYLSEGEFYIYMENGKPKIAMSTTDDKLEEIQGLKNNSIIPSEYAQMIEDFIKENNLKDTVGGVFQTELNFAKQPASRTSI